MRGRLLYIARRMREPSTAAGVAMLAAMFGVDVGLSQDLAQGLAGIAALVAILLPETKAGA